MNHEEFEKILDKRLSEIKEVLGNKAKEYAFNDDRLHNFKVASNVVGLSPQKALWGMAAKHLVSVIDLVEGRLVNTTHNCDEKIGDLINYLILLEAVFAEQRFSWASGAPVSEDEIQAVLDAVNKRSKPNAVSHP